MNKPLFFIGIFSLLAAGYLTWQRYTPTRLAFDTMVFSTNASAGQVAPTSLDIPSLSLTLPVASEELQGNKWPLSDRGVVYVANTPLPGEIGNSIIYGHNWPNILGKLPKIRPGWTIEVGFSDGSRRRFIVEYTQEVTPDQTHVLAPTGDKRITLYTCSGFLDRKRFVTVALLSQN